MGRAPTRRLPRLVLAVAAVIGQACGGGAPTAPSRSETLSAGATGLLAVNRVIDGDTIVVDTIGTVRLIGVDTPETVAPNQPVECFGPEASQFTTRLVSGRMVRLDFDVDRTDRFGRTLAYVYLADTTLVNGEIVRQGYGRAYTVFPFRYLQQFQALEREARQALRGLWGACAST